MFTLESEVLAKARVFESVTHQARNLKVVGSSPTVVKNFSFCILSLSMRSLQDDWSHTNEIKHYIIRGNRCIERMIT